MSRKVLLEIETKIEFNKLINEFIYGLGYSVIRFDSNSVILEKGKKILTIIGLTDPKFIHRKVYITYIAKNENTYSYKLVYEFPWYTNIGYLPRLVHMEAQRIKNNIRDLKVKKLGMIT
ncbi:MAG: hypothetical protein QXS24_00280 [Desulfurococcaceae archaeon]